MLSELVDEQPEEETPEDKPKGLMAKVSNMAFNWEAFAARFIEGQTKAKEKTGRR